MFSLFLAMLLFGTCFFCRTADITSNIYYLLTTTTQHVSNKCDDNVIIHMFTGRQQVARIVLLLFIVGAVLFWNIRIMIVVIIWLSACWYSCFCLIRFINLLLLLLVFSNFYISCCPFILTLQDLCSISACWLLSPLPFLSSLI